MYVGLIVRDEGERSMKNQASKVESVDFATSSREATREKATCEAHDWKMKSYARLSILATVSREGPTRESFYLAKSCILLYQVFIHIIYTLITHKL